MSLPLHTYIDHTMLKPDAVCQDIVKLCDEAKQYQFAAVCVSPVWAKLTKERLTGSAVKLCSVVGFPLGTSSSAVKTAETAQLVQIGADEIDMVIHIGALKDKEYAKVKDEIKAVVQAAIPAVVKVIIETCLLTDEEKRIAAQLCVDAGAHYVKTSTGFSKGGATVQDVALLRAVVGPNFGVKASGGIRDRVTALEMIEAGATRLGTSSGIAIIEGKTVDSGKY